MDNLTVIVILENLFIIPKPVNLFPKLKSYLRIIDKWYNINDHM